MTENRKERLRYYKQIAQSKGYRQESIEMGWMLACTVDMVKKYGSIDKALDEVIKICEDCNDGTKFVGKIVELIDSKYSTD